VSTKSYRRGNKPLAENGHVHRLRHHAPAFRYAGV